MATGVSRLIEGSVFFSEKSYCEMTYDGLRKCFSKEKYVFMLQRVNTTLLEHISFGICSMAASTEVVHSFVEWQDWKFERNISLIHRMSSHNMTHDFDVLDLLFHDFDVINLSIM
jgi:hypothetical protein